MKAQQAKPKAATTAAAGKDKDKASVSLPPVNSKPAAAASPAKAAQAPKPAAKPAAAGDKSKLPVIQGVKPDAPSSTGDAAAATTTSANETTTTPTLPSEAGASEAQEIVQPAAIIGQGEVSGQTAAEAPTAIAPTAATAAAAEAESPALPVYKPEEHNGMVKLIYEQYNEEFPIVNGSTTQENVDEVYCLSFVMPGCLVHLSTLPPAEKRKRDIESQFEGMYVEENPRGTYRGLCVGDTYYVYVEQEAEQLARDQEMMRQRAKAQSATSAASVPLPKDDGRVLESCSCIYGNPCVDEYGCKDWSNRYAVATKNGWKGF